MPADYHTHTPLCHHAVGEPEAFVDAALEAGLTEYGISDHAPQVPEPFDDWRMDLAQLPDYFAWIARARAHAGGRIPIRAGMECDWLDGCEPWIAELASRYEWDYLIGSVHYLEDWDFDNQALPPVLTRHLVIFLPILPLLQEAHFQQNHLQQSYINRCISPWELTNFQEF